MHYFVMGIASSARHIPEPDERANVGPDRVSIKFQGFGAIAGEVEIGNRSHSFPPSCFAPFRSATMAMAWPWPRPNSSFREATMAPAFTPGISPFPVEKPLALPHSRN